LADAAPIPLDGSELTFQAWKLLEAEKDALGIPELHIQPVLPFRDAADRNPTTLEERQAILDQASLMFEHLYPHLPFKLDHFIFAKPVEFIDQHIRTQLAQLSETRFHSFVIAAFSLVRDAHTLYGLPSPYRGAVAFLPFEMRPYTDAKGRHYVVSRVMNTGHARGFGHPFFGPGAEILRWGNEDIDGHVFRAAGRLAGGNESAVVTRASIHCTLRPLTFLQFPFDEETPAATVGYCPAGRAEIRSVILPWGVATGLGKTGGFPSTAFSMSAVTAAVRTCGRVLHYREQLPQHSAPAAPAAPDDLTTVSQITRIFQFQYTGGRNAHDPIELSDLADPANPNARFGYIRISSFEDGSNAPDATAGIVAEFQRILTLMDRVAPDGLVLDLRSNPGGDVQAAEQMLQMLTPRRITPARFHLANTPAILQVLQTLRDAGSKGALASADDVKLHDARAEFLPWLSDAGNVPFPQGERLTSGQSLTDPNRANDTGQIYQGRVVLLIDALTYSAADIFAGGFQDHDIGLIVGSDTTTGGGGANVWSHDDLLNKLGPKPAIPLAPLPRDVQMSIAIRRSARVERFAAQPIEDLGVGVDVRYASDSVEDVIAGRPGMLRAACATLTALGAPGVTPFRGLHTGLFRIDVTNVAFRQDGGLVVELATKNIATLKFFIDGVLATTEAVQSDGAHSFAVPPAGFGLLAALRIEGYAANNLVAARVISLAAPTAPEPDEDPALVSPTGAEPDNAT
jgi:hypothetical protein